MALFTDSPVLALLELRAHETQILDTASVEGIDLTAKIELSKEEIGLEILSALRRLASQDAAGVSLNTLVMTSALRLWHVFHTLEIVYRDAFNNQLNDRYRGKCDEYRNLSRFASALLFQMGLGVVTDPISEAAAPTLAAASGFVPPGSYFVRIAWLNSAGQEGAAGQLASIDVTADTFQVTPTSQPSNAAAYNVYAGTTPEDLFRQNGSPMAVTDTWTAQGAIVTNGPRAGQGQEPDFLRQVPRAVLRG